MAEPEDLNETDDNEGDDRPTTGVRRAPPGLRRLLARVVEGPDAGAEASAGPDEALVVGSAPDATLRLRDPEVSPYHCEIVPMTSGFHLRDLGSRAHTYVREARVDAGILPAGTRIRVGSTVVTLEDGGPAEGRIGAMESKPTLPGVVIASLAMRTVAQRAQEVAPTEQPVLLEGERGTGKRTLARAIHELSPRRHGPFVVVRCGTTAPTLVAHELFGSEHAAPSAAEHAGAVRRAAGGTLLLEAIGELPLDVQPLLLEVIQRGEPDVRILASSMRDLRIAANAGSFRPELYRRIGAARIVIPPLRERPEDVAPLAHHFARDMTERADFVFDEQTLDAFRTHPWGGNGLELRDAVGSTVVKSGAAMAMPRRTPRPAYRTARAEAIAEFERRYLGALIHDCQGNASEAARQAHMDRAYLVSLLKKHGLR